MTVILVIRAGLIFQTWSRHFCFVSLLGFDHLITQTVAEDQENIFLTANDGKVHVSPIAWRDDIMSQVPPTWWGYFDCVGSCRFSQRIWWWSSCKLSLDIYSSSPESDNELDCVWDVTVVFNPLPTVGTICFRRLLPLNMMALPMLKLSSGTKFSAELSGQKSQKVASVWNWRDKFFVLDLT